MKACCDLENPLEIGRRLKKKVSASDAPLKVIRVFLGIILGICWDPPHPEPADGPCGRGWQGFRSQEPCRDKGSENMVKPSHIEFFPRPCPKLRGGGAGTVVLLDVMLIWS